MNVREFNLETDYEDVQSWWTQQGWPAIPPQFLGLKGFIAEGETKHASTWIYKDPSCGLCVMEWMVGNPASTWEQRRDALDLTMNACLTWAKEQGGLAVLTMTKNKRLIDKLKDQGFQESDKDMVHLIRSL